MCASQRSIDVAVFLGLILASTISTSRAADNARPAIPTGAAQSPAAPMVQAALEAEARGDKQERDTLVRRAISADPHYDPAHWQNGEVLVNDLWLPVNQATTEMRSAGYVTLYRHKQAHTPAKYAAQCALGDWCASKGLDPQARVHWAMGLLLKPDSPDLITKLGMTQYGSRLVPADQFEQIRQRDQDAAAATPKWFQALDRIQTSFKSDTLDDVSSAVDELDSIKDALAIPAMEKASINGGPAFAEAIVDALAGMPEQAATDALVREAVSSKYAGAREAAAKRLRDRSLFAYVPTLIHALQAPIKVEFEQDSARHRLAMTQDGPLAAYEYFSANGTSMETILHVHPKRGYTDVSVRPHADTTLAQDRVLARAAEEHNAKAEVMNPYVVAALKTATGKNAGDAPADWWRWWLDHNEIYQYPQKPVVSTVRNYVPTSGYRVTYSSCFVKGTKVWTMDGPLAIEQVKAGECVLAQHPATGELTYKPVIATTTRPRSPVRAIKTKGETILATRGHPFWVSGVGWRMVKELKVGDRLHTVTGPVEIIAADDAGEAVCYNLVVADFGNYFVGEEKALVHDNTIRDVTPALVPGLVVK